MQFEFVVVECSAETLLERPACLKRGVHLLLEEHEAATRLCLRSVQGDITISEKLVRIVAINGRDRDPDAGAHHGVLVPEVERRLEGGQKPSRKDGNCVWLTDSRLNDRKFVAAEPRHRVLLAHAAPQSFRDGNEKCVASWMAEAIIDLLEPVEVQTQNRERFRAALGPGQSPLQTISKENTVRQTGECVMMGEEMDPLFRALPVGDVAHSNHVSASAGVGQRFRMKLERQSQSRPAVARQPRRAVPRLQACSS